MASRETVYFAPAASVIRVAEADAMVMVLPLPTSVGTKVSTFPCWLSTRLPRCPLSTPLEDL